MIPLRIINFVGLNIYAAYLSGFYSPSKKTDFKIKSTFIMNGKYVLPAAIMLFTMPALYSCDQASNVETVFKGSVA